MAGNIQNDDPLIEAVKKQDTGLVKKLLAKGANPNIQDKNLRTPLILAAMYSTHPFYNDTEIYNHL